MPITSQEVVDGPRVQGNGSRTGAIRFDFADGRSFTVNVEAANATDWANLLIDMPAQMEADIAAADAEAASHSGDEIVDAEAGEATREELAVAYLRNATSLEDPYEAYLQYARFNTYRLSRGWSVTQVVAGLASAGLEQEEWDELYAEYQYISNTGHVTTMVAYQTIADYWANR